MNVTAHEWQNAQALIHERRQRLQAEGSTSSKGKQPVIIQQIAPDTEADQIAAQLFGGTAAERNHKRPDTESPCPAEALTAEEMRQARQFFGLTSLDDLKTEHMSVTAAMTYQELLTAVRDWRQANVPGEAFILCSPGKGAGKTHIAKAAMDSFSRVFWTGARPCFYGGGPREDGGVTLERRGALLTARQCMELVGEGEGWHRELAARRLELVVLDDVGREGLLKFIRQDETQTTERQARYYEFINFCYERKLKLFITSNLLWEQMERFFNGATWSRLNEMAPAGNVFELRGVPDYRLLKSGRQPAMSR